MRLYERFDKTHENRMPQMANYIPYDTLEKALEGDKNQPCIIMWSTGNENGHGENHIEMIKWTRKRDNTRLIHCEDASRKGDSSNVDVVSHMFLGLDYMKEYGENAQNTILRYFSTRIHRTWHFRFSPTHMPNTSMMSCLILEVFHRL